MNPPCQADPRPRRKSRNRHEWRSMARKKRRSKVRPKMPARIKKRTRRTRSHRHPELVGLGLLAVGVFIGSVLYLGWNGGYVGGALADVLRWALGAAGYGLLSVGVHLGAPM